VTDTGILTKSERRHVMRSRRFVRIAAGVVVVIALAVAVAVPASAGPRPKPTPSPDTTPPSKPTNLHVTAVTHTSVSLAWTASTDNVGVMTYSLWGEGLSGVVSSPHPQTSGTWTGLRPGQTVTFRVTAFDARYNASQPSDPVSVTTVPDTTPPSTPSGLTVEQVKPGMVLLSWNSGTDEFQPVRHEILVNGEPTPNAASTVPAGTIPRPAVQSAWVRHLEPSTSYEFSVRAVDPSGNVSRLSNTASATTEASADTVAPTSPFLTSASDLGTGSCPEELWFSFNASTDDRSAIDYELRLNGVIVEVIPEGGATNSIAYHEFRGTFTVTIVAVDMAGNASAPSNAITVSTQGGCF
jgi:chitodextrinase